MKSEGAPSNYPSSIAVVVIGGVDPSGGAGLLRDVYAARALGVDPHAIGTAWTEQASGAHRVEARAPDGLAAAVRQAVARRPAAIKIGMVPDAAAATALVAALAGVTAPVVVDPVLASSRGGPLWQGPTGGLLPLLRRATLVTPNALEAAALAGRPVRTLDDAAAAAASLREAGVRAVLVKGGHLEAGHSDDGGAMVTDLLVSDAGARALAHPRLPGPSPRGTGCALATAIAVELGRGATLDHAVDAATAWLGRAICAARDVGGERHLP
jgi:hydroxymethylpyrimidine/phosphomethylpyrimidine kinase